MVMQQKILNGQVEDINQNPEPKEFEPVGVNVGHTVPSPAPASRVSYLSVVNERNTRIDELGQLRLSQPEDPNQVSSFTGQSIIDLAAQDEERSMHTDYLVPVSFENAQDPIARSGFAESGLQNQTDNKLQPLERESTQTKIAKPSKTTDMNASFGGMPDLPSDPYGQNTACRAHHQFMLHQLQQLLQKQNMFPRLAHMNEQVLQNCPCQNPNHYEQLAILSGPECDHRQCQLKLQRQQIQQQQLHLEEQHLLQELLRLNKLLGQLHGPGQRRVDPLRANNNARDQVFLNQPIVRQLQHLSCIPNWLADPYLETFIQEKFGLAATCELRQVQNQLQDLQSRQRDNVYEDEERPSPEEQFGHLEQGITLQDRLQQGLSERSVPLPTGPSGMNLDVKNVTAHAHALNMQQESNTQHGPHLYDLPECHWSEKLFKDNFKGSQFQQCTAPQHQVREPGVRVTSEMLDRYKEEQSKWLLMNMLTANSSNRVGESVNCVPSNPFNADQGANGVVRPVNLPRRHPPLGKATEESIYDTNKLAGASYSLLDESATKDRALISMKGQEDSRFRRFRHFRRHPPVPLHDNSTEIVSDSVCGARFPSTSAGEGSRQGSSKKLPSNKTSSPTKESLDGSQHQGQGRSKRKGKKGKPIDPAFLGFKVASNRDNDDECNT